MILIKNGRVIDPKSGTDETLDILIEEGKIAGIGKYKRSNEYERIIEAEGKIVAPGLIDVHVHFRDPGLTYKEDIESGAKAAAAGGFTTVVCMANTKPPVDNADTLSYVLKKGKKTGIHVLSVAAVTKGMKGKELTDFAELKKAKAVGLSDDGIPIKDSRLMYEALKRAKEEGLAISLHEEDPDFVFQAGINKGAVSESLGIGGAMALSEQLMVARDCTLALETGARVSIQHVSSKIAVEYIRLAQKLGADVWAEATPQHFSLTEKDALEKKTLAKVNPPLRTEDDRYGIIEGLKDGTIQIIATDHAPHSAEEKDREITKAPSGMIGLETALALGITNLVRTGSLTMEYFLKKMTLNPAELYGLDSGYIAEGAPADLVIFDEFEKWKVEKFHSRSNNSPFIGEELYGKVKYTICSGRVVYEDKE
ncbi:dihydroorotase [Mediterraneibacter massiliensis]|uniref:dihydroorotase n=1 Tax=Mediterraneibacter massiliensis TaxID=1720300 RepID=UPI0024AC92F0|nr:dihydroorotase [Mediterraneibacter massiliensis]